jgi:hypothetical protein
MVAVYPPEGVSDTGRFRFAGDDRSRQPPKSSTNPIVVDYDYDNDNDNDNDNDKE